MIIIKYKQKINYLYIKVIYKQKFYYKDIGLNIYLYNKTKKRRYLFVNNKKKIYLLVTIIYIDDIAIVISC